MSVHIQMDKVVKKYNKIPEIAKCVSGVRMGVNKRGSDPFI